MTRHFYHNQTHKKSWADTFSRDLLPDPSIQPWVNLYNYLPPFSLPHDPIYKMNILIATHRAVTSLVNKSQVT